LALDELVFERFQVRVIELKLQLEGPIGEAAPFAQEGDRLINYCDKVHPIPPCVVSSSMLMRKFIIA
jgi:hypothetical protein